MTMEMIPYSETQRDRVERRLALQASKRELIDERRHDLSIRVYWLKLTNEVSMSLATDDGARREFLIPNDSVLDARDHPEAFADRAGMPRRADDVVD